MSPPPYNPPRPSIDFNVSHTLPRPIMDNQSVKSSYNEDQKLPPISWLPTPQISFAATTVGSHERHDRINRPSGMYTDPPLDEDFHASLSKRPNGSDWEGHQRRPPPPHAQHESEMEDLGIPMEE